ncbi:MAG: MarR family winged helix-turn-helix transcriptional regulator [Pseudonocardiaceae bacterium]
MAVDAARQTVVDQLVEALPDWINTVAQLNILIAERMGVVPSDMDCLHALNRHGPATARVLTQRVGLTPGSVSRMIDRLDAADCIKRVPDPDDRRRVLIEPTVEGIARASAYYAGLTARIHEDLKAFDTNELRLLLRFIKAGCDSTAAEVARLRSGHC